MDLRAKEKHEEEHEDSKKERGTRTTSHSIKNHNITSLIWKQSSRRTENHDEEQCMEDL